MNKKGIIGIILVALIGFAVYYFLNKKETQNTTKEIVKIGAVLPLSGEVASYGLDSKKGIDLAIELANKSQNKYQFEVVYQDSKGDSKTAVTALQQLISTINPSAVIGENISSATGAMIPVADKNKVLLISPSASASNLSGLSKYFFRVFPSDDAEGAFICKTIANQHPKGKVSIIYVNNDYGLGLKNVFEKEAIVNSLTISSINAFNKDQKDFRSILAKINSESLDAIYIPSYYENGALLVKQIREQGIKADIYGCTTHEDPKFLEIAGNASEGFQYPISTGYDETNKNESVLKFISSYETINGKKPGLVTALGYDCAKIIIDATLLANEYSSNGIRDYMLTTNNIEGAAGTMNFDKSGNVHKPIILKIVKNSKFINVIK